MAQKKPEAVEAVPSVDELLGVNKRADQFADAVLAVAEQASRLSLQQTANDRKDSDPIDGLESETYGSRRRELQAQIKRIFDQADKDGFRTRLDEVLARRKG